MLPQSSLARRSAAWHEVSKRRGAAISLLWAAAVARYLIDRRAGLFALLPLSLLHIFLEFPLNYRTFAGIGRELFARR